MLCPELAVFGGELDGIRVEPLRGPVVNFPNPDVSTLAVAQVALAYGRATLLGATQSCEHRDDRDANDENNSCMARGFDSNILQSYDFVPLWHCIAGLQPCNDGADLHDSMCGCGPATMLTRRDG